MSVVLKQPRRPRRGDVWWVDLDPVRGHEQAGTRPVVVVSADGFDTRRWGMALVCPITRRARPNRLHVTIDPPEGGLRTTSFVLCEQVRAVSIERFEDHSGMVSLRSLSLILDTLRELFDL